MNGPTQLSVDGGIIEGGLGTVLLLEAEAAITSTVYLVLAKVSAVYVDKAKVATAGSFKEDLLR